MPSWRCCCCCCCRPRNKKDPASTNENGGVENTGNTVASGTAIANDYQPQFGLYDSIDIVDPPVSFPGAENVAINEGKQQVVFTRNPVDATYDEIGPPGDNQLNESAVPLASTTAPGASHANDPSQRKTQTPSDEYAVIDKTMSGASVKGSRRKTVKSSVTTAVVEQPSAAEVGQEPPVVANKEPEDPRRSKRKPRKQGVSNTVIAGEANVAQLKQELTRSGTTPVRKPPVAAKPILFKSKSEQNPTWTKFPPPTPEKRKEPEKETEDDSDGGIPQEEDYYNIAMAKTPSPGVNDIEFEMADNCLYSTVRQ